jgi:DNA-binding NarL/FixJ family response regulator
VVADDHPIVLNSLVQLLETDDTFRVLGQFNDGEAALEAVRRFKPDIAVVDFQMPKKTGIEVLRTIKEEGLPTRLILITGVVSEDAALEAVRLGVAGIVLKEAAPRQLLQAVQDVAGGSTSIDSKVVRRAVEKMLRTQAALTEARRLLTPREIEVVRLVAKGLRNKEIAELLSIGEGTVKIHLHSVYEKTGMSGRMELSNYARERSLV